MWQHGAAPSAAIQLGTNDLGLVQGFYARQNDDGMFRWSRSEARALVAGMGDHICLRVNAARPPHVPAPLVTIGASNIAGSFVTLGRITPPRQGWAWACVPAPPHKATTPIELHVQTTSYHPFEFIGGNDTRDLGVAVAAIELRAGALSIDSSTGLLLDHLAPPTSADATLALIGISGKLKGRAGTTVPLTLWWRDPTAPPADAFTFLHVLDAQGATVASYNAPLAAGHLPAPWAAGEPLADNTALPLPPNLAPGSYRLAGGAFDPASGRVLAQSDLGTLAVSAP